MNAEAKVCNAESRWRPVLGGGLGCHVIKTKNTVFDVFGGGDYEQEHFSATPPF